MFTSKEIRNEHWLSTRKVSTRCSRRGGRQCVPLTLMAESIRSFRVGETPNQKKLVEEIRRGSTIRRRFS